MGSRAHAVPSYPTGYMHDVHDLYTAIRTYKFVHTTYLDLSPVLICKIKKVMARMTGFVH